MAVQISERIHRPVNPGAVRFILDESGVESAEFLESPTRRRTRPPTESKGQKKHCAEQKPTGFDFHERLANAKFPDRATSIDDENRMSIGRKSDIVDGVG